MDVLKYLNKTIEIAAYLHINYSGQLNIGNIGYHFSRSRNKFWYIPFSTIFKIRKEAADIIWVQGFKYPLQLLMLKLIIGTKTKIIIQHHGEHPFAGLKKLCQKLAGRITNAYLFTSVGIADEWINAGIINSRTKCFEVLEASTYFTTKNKQESYARTGIKKGVQNFLWVGRLDKNKDPLTVLTAFKQYIVQYPDAHLYMIYQTEDLLPEVKSMLSKSRELQNAVHLAGQVSHNELSYWFSAADFFISGSHSEAAGYALIECMACGCIPIVTNIPSFRKITAEGKHGLLYDPGNANTLYDALLRTTALNSTALSADIIKHFSESLSFSAIGTTLSKVFKKLQ